MKGTKTIKVDYSFWYDLVFHAFSNLPTAPGDAGRLYDKEYVEWVNCKFSNEAQKKRTLQEDAPVLSSLYDKTAKAFRLQVFPLLFDNFDEFSATMEMPFHEISWPDGKREELAGIVRRDVPSELIEIFRIALWSEERAGFRDIHATYYEPLYKQQLPQLEDELIKIAAEVKGFEATQLIVSIPLRRFGRAMRTGKEPLVVVGLPIDELSVPLWAPVMQGCHEYVLGRVLSFLNTGADSKFASDSDVNTRKDSPGYHYHMAPEIAALSIEAQLFQNTYRTRYTQWVRQWFPSGSAALADALPWDVREFPMDKKKGHNKDEQLVEWLASGQLVPEPFRQAYTGARDWFFST